MSHTPGPWNLEIGMDVKVKCPDGRSFNIGDALYHPENIHNGRLVSSAPDLLDAVEKFIDINYAQGYEFDSNEPDVWSALVDAVNKAREANDGK